MVVVGGRLERGIGVYPALNSVYMSRFHYRRFIMADTKTEDLKPKTAEFKVAEIRPEGTVVLYAADGKRMFTASVKEGLEGVRKGSKVNITSDGEDETGAHKSAQIIKVL